MASRIGSVVIVSLMATQQIFSWPVSQQALSKQSWNSEATVPGFKFQLYILAPSATFLNISFFISKMG